MSPEPRPTNRDPEPDLTPQPGPCAEASFLVIDARRDDPPEADADAAPKTILDADAPAVLAHVTEDDSNDGCDTVVVNEDQDDDVVDDDWPDASDSEAGAGEEEAAEREEEREEELPVVRDNFEWDRPPAPGEEARFRGLAAGRNDSPRPHGWPLWGSQTRTPASLRTAQHCLKQSHN